MLDTVMKLMRLLGRPDAAGERVQDLLPQGHGLIVVERVHGRGGATDFVTIQIDGHSGKKRGGSAPTLGIVGRLGGVGARPSVPGLVSDGDGAVAALAAGLTLADMAGSGDRLAGDVIVTTQLCPDAPVVPHDPVPFMGSVVSMEVKNRYEVLPEMDAILSVDTTKGNRIMNHRGIAITPTVKEGWILRVSPDLLDIYEAVVGEPPHVLALTTQDILPYGHDIHHLNSMMQPACATAAPVVGVAITAATVVPGAASFASHAMDIELAARFCCETAVRVGNGAAGFYDALEFEQLTALYGPLNHLQSLP